MFFQATDGSFQHKIYLIYSDSYNKKRKARGLKARSLESLLGKLLKSICCSTFCHYKFQFQLEATVKAYMLRLAQGLDLTLGLA